MPSHQSLAELTLHWCAREVLAGGDVKTTQRDREALAKTSREASKAAGVALLQASAAEMEFADSATLGLIAAVIEDDDAMAALEDRLAGHSHETGSPQERAAFVGHHFKEWMIEQAGDELPARMQGWLQRGWPDLRARGGVMTFYQAFCGALQRTVRQDQATWDNLMKNTGVEAATWRQWLIREADTGAQTSAQTSRKRSAAKAFVIILLMAAVVGAGAWYWWNEIHARLRALDQESTENSLANPPSPDRREVTPTPPAATPEPKAAQQIPPKGKATPSPAEVPIAAAPVTPATPKPAEELPRVKVNSDPMAEATRLIREAEATLVSKDHEAGDRSARSAQDILVVRPPTNDAKLAEGLIRVAQYWERRDDWAEAARLYQRAVKAYEKTPAENANPQLQAVSHWASALRHTGRNTEAEQLYRMLLQAYEGMGTELRPEMASVAHNLGNVLFATGRLRDAREAYALALKLMVDEQSEPSAEPMLSRFKQSYSECLRKLGVSEAQIEADLRQTLGAKPSPKTGPNR